MAIKINEIFYSIQGEGVLSGAPTIFIRTAGCNLRCAWCDTEYAFYEGKARDINEILDEISGLRERTGCNRVCLTGGEPLIVEEVPELVFKLLSHGFHLTLETNGSISLSSLLHGLRDHPAMRTSLLISLDMKCPSSGEEQRNDLDNLILLNPGDQLKFVVKNLEDLDYSFGIIHEHPVPCPIIIQPVMAKELEREHLEKLADAVLRESTFQIDLRFMLQLHKIIWGDKKGV